MQFSEQARIDTTLQGTQHHRTQPLASGGVLGNGRYELRGIVGRGAMAEVRDGWDLRLGRPVAIKLLHPGLDTRLEGRLRFEMEARAAAQLTGRHVVVVHDVGEEDGQPFIVLERLPGVSLADHIGRGSLPPAFVHAVLDSVLAALAEAHHVGILHRDVKPGNILFTSAGDAKLADFGIAKTAGVTHTRAGEIVGSMAYLSPDRLASKPATVADDLYAVGVVGYEALTGRRPFPQKEIGALAQAILHESPPPLAALRPDVPLSLVTAIERAMARDPAQRFGHANAMRSALAGNAPAPVRPGSTRVMEAPALVTYTADWRYEPPNPHRKLWAAAFLAALVLAFILLAVDASSSSVPPTRATTTTPLPPPTTAVVSTSAIPSSAAPQPPPPQPPPGPGRNHPGKKHKGGQGN